MVPNPNPNPVLTGKDLDGEGVGLEDDNHYSKQTSRWVH